jgi:hypothetical protein
MDTAKKELIYANAMKVGQVFHVIIKHAKKIALVEEYVKTGNVCV